MRSLVDTDILLYRIGFTTENEDEGIARARFNEMAEGILSETGATSYQFWLSDSTANNFRTKIYPEYKANRKDFKKPKHYDFLKDLAIEEWGARVTVGQEADDALGIEQTKDYNSLAPASERTIICSIDKDLHQIPGNHYNFVKKESSIVEPEDGRKFFYQQLLKGDSVDNLQGAPGIGDAKAAKALGSESSEVGLFRLVRDCYMEQYRNKIFNVKELSEKQSEFVTEQLLVNGICLKIRQEENELWKFPE